MGVVSQHLAESQGGTTDPEPPLSATEFVASLTHGFDPVRAGHILAVAWGIVRRFAPDAPEAVQREAVIRFGGYLAQSDFGGIRQETIGPLTTEYVVNHQAAFRNCGAMALLSPWKVRRAGAIG